MSNKIGRNEKCPCGSGLKYKNCCMNKDTTENLNINDNSWQSLPTSYKIIDSHNNRFYRVITGDYVEKVNPIEFYRNFEIKQLAIFYKDLIETKDPILAKELTPQSYINKAKKDIQQKEFEITFTPERCHENFMKVLEATKKKDQVSLLQGLSLNLRQLYFLIIEAYQKHQYLYSRYRYESLPDDLKNKKKPILVELKENNTVNSIGPTELSEGQLKRMIEQRKVIVAHFFDRGENWHCLFTTYKSLEGKENHKNGQPHFHYISKAFGVSREEFLESLKNGTYRSTSVHIDLLDYNNHPKK